MRWRHVFPTATRSRSRQISSATVVAYDDLGPEALYALEITAFPVVVIIDRYGGNFHETARAKWKKPAMP
jgi:fumarate hydratase subunit beta